jgi:hypothetical protein
MWGLTAQNEPNDGRVPEFSFNCMGWTAAQQVKEINHNTNINKCGAYNN